MRPLTLYISVAAALTVDSACAATTRANETRQPEDTIVRQATPESAPAPSNIPTVTPNQRGGMVLVEGGQMPGDLPEILRKKFYAEFSGDIQPAALGPFEIGKCEVTWAEWHEVAEWATRNGKEDFERGNGHPANHPATGMSWLDCVLWCNAKSEKEGLKPVYTFDDSGDVGRGGAGSDPSANGYRLPTQLEWMWAAAGGNKSKGFVYSGGNDPDEVAWHAGNSGGEAAAAGLKWPNELGLYDMSGNAEEWCEDGTADPDSSYRCFGDSYDSAPSLWNWAEEERATKRGDGMTGFRLARGSKPERRQTAQTKPSE